MGKELDKFLSEHKKIMKQAQELGVATGDKMKKELLANLDRTWAAEDVMQEAVQKARLSGVQGKKSADFVKLAPVAKAMTPWRDALGKHSEGLKKLEAFCDVAKNFQSGLEKRLATIQQEMKKEGGTADVKTMAKIKEAQRAVTDIKKSAGIMGTLPGPAVMYGANVQRTIDGVVKNALAGVDPKEFPKAFEAANRARTARMLKDHPRNIEKLCKLAMKEIDSGKLDKTEKPVKAAQKLLAELEALDSEGQKVVKQMKKELAAAQDGKAITEMIKLAAKTAKSSGAQIEELLDALSEAEENSET